MAGFRGIDVLVGGAGQDMLTGRDAISTWALGVDQTYADGTATLTFSAFETLQGGSLQDTFDLSGNTLGTVSAELRGGDGGDRFQFQGASTLAGSIHGEGGTDKLGYATFASVLDVILTGSDSTGVEGAESSSFTGGVFTGVDVLVGSLPENGPDQLTGENVASSWSLGAAQIYDDGAATLAFSDIEILQGGSQANSFTVESTLPGQNIVLRGGEGDDSFVIGSAGFSTGGTVRLIRSQVRVDGEGGRNSLRLDNSTAATPDTVNVTPTEVGEGAGDMFFGGGGLTYSGISALELSTSSAAAGDLIRLTPSPTTEFFVNGGPPTLPDAGDVRELDLTGVSGTELALTSPTSGSYTFDNRQPVTFTDIEKLAEPAAHRPSQILVVGAGEGATPHVVVFDAATGAMRFNFLAYDAAFMGGVRVAVGDVDGDGIDDIITGAGPGAGPHVKVFSGRDLSLLASFYAYTASFTGGVFVAAGNFDADSELEVVTGAGPGGGPHVRIFDIADGVVSQVPGVLGSFFAYDSAFRGGVAVAVADFNGVGDDEVITGAQAGGGGHVRVFRSDGAELVSFFAFPATFVGGVYVASGDIDGDGNSEIIVGAGSGGEPSVAIFNGGNATPRVTFNAYTPNFNGGVRVGVVDQDDDGQVDILTGVGPGGGPHVRVSDGLSLTELNSFFAFNQTFQGGTFVAGH